ncbi:CDK5 regulatory subunit-associated protein 3 [Geodia barretti]|uniref:CDK5 regulatory subunit-associated protein 3 n=1 Tax=Geodia barretti TaxID=519541 RepID=A0AA35X7A7_GEOBA|nr:CDK5 regulatory subunit-associated protein 3 [Geodia barretti]
MRMREKNMDGELELPIDIHYNKLLDWLIDRRHCDSKWTVQIRRIREKINASLPSLPPDQLATLGDRPALNYFQCRQILETVKTVDGDSKSLFGKYNSPRVQEWAEIVRDFEKGGVYLADCAQQLTRNVNYEIPALKQSLARSQQIQQDTLKREQEARSTAASLRQVPRLMSGDGYPGGFIPISCSWVFCLHLQGEGVREELQDLLSELPGIFQQTLDGLQSLSPALSYYQTVVETNTGRPVDPPTFLPVLHYLMTNGNVTVYRWRHGVEPETEVLQELPAGSQQPQAGDIDWGDLSSDIQSDGIENQSDGIDWDNPGILELGDIVVLEDSAVEKGGEGGRQEEGVASLKQQSKSCADSAGDLETLLSSPVTRALFLDDIMELKEFISWRLRELTRTDDILSGQFSGDGGEVKQKGAESVQSMLDCVLAVLTPLTSPRTQHLLLMKSSGHYLDRMASSLLSPQLLANKAQAQAELAVVRRDEAVAMAMSVEPQLSGLSIETRSLQRQVEQEISLLYRQREVNIIGEINVTLQQHQ